MGRMTERFSNGQAASYWCGNNCKYDHKYCYANAENCPAMSDIYEKLAHYEDMEEHGRLIELPCAVGDTVWEIDEYAAGFKARPMTVLSIKLKENKGFVYTAYSDERDNFVRGYGFDDFGEILFLTKEEAEAKLKELEG